jgi:hypothetical protein
VGELVGGGGNLRFDEVEHRGIVQKSGAGIQLLVLHLVDINREADEENVMVSFYARIFKRSLELESENPSWR